MSDTYTPTKDWFTHVDSVTSLVGSRRYGLEDDELAEQLIKISADARRFAESAGRSGRMSTDWSYLSYHLATMGIPSDVYEDVATNPEDDPWMPPNGAEIVLVAITKPDAGRLAALIAERGSGE